jgi:nitrogen fixation/metabolism regulation signal transduction histidine kinase
MTLTQAATVLQQSYDALTTRLQQMDLELAQTNASLREHLRETEEMRAHVTAVLESLDTGVIVADSQDSVVRCNHATERLLGGSASPPQGASSDRGAGGNPERPRRVPAGASDGRDHCPSRRAT